MSRFPRCIRPAYVDLDGVMNDLVRHVLNLFGSTLDPCAFSPETQYCFHGVLGVSYAEFWHRIDSCHDFWETIPAYPWANDLLDLLHRRGFRPVFITSPMQSSKAAAGKLRWIQNRFGADFQDWIICRNKANACVPGRILIDDQDNNNAAWEKAGGLSILFPALTNRNRPFLNDPIAYVESRLNLLDAFI